MALEKEEEIITISKKEYDNFQNLAQNSVILTLQVLKKFNMINDSLLNMVSFVANQREDIFKTLNLPDNVSGKT